MRKNKIYFGKSGKRLKNLFHFGLSLSLLAIVSVCLQVETFAQTGKKTKTAAKKKPAKIIVSDRARVKQIDAVGLLDLLKREGETAKPLLVNFWATWCVPCVEEFPELVKIDADYKGKIDLITISLDDLAEINRDVPKFLAGMKATMPAYLLKTQNEEAAIASVSKDWQGGLPFTILFDAKGKTVYIKQGKFKPEILRAELEKIIVKDKVNEITEQNIISASASAQSNFTYIKGKADAQKDIASGKLIVRKSGIPIFASRKFFIQLKERYGIEIYEAGCVPPDGFSEYARGYNKISVREIKRRFGNKVLDMLTE